MVQLKIWNKNCYLKRLMRKLNIFYYFLFSFIFFLYAIILTNCSNNRTSSQPVEVCVLGWWQSPSPSKCLCPGSPECDTSDCKVFQLLGYKADGTSYSGTIAISEERGTMSSQGKIITDHYEIVGKELLYTFTNGNKYSYSFTCEGNRIVVNNIVSVRVSAQLSSSLDRAVQDGNQQWTGFPINQ